MYQLLKYFNYTYWLIKLFQLFQYIGVRIKAGQQACWFDDESPCALGNITGTGNFGTDENKQYSKIIFDFIEKQLGVPQNRYIHN